MRKGNAIKFYYLKTNSEKLRKNNTISFASNFNSRRRDGSFQHNRREELIDKNGARQAS